MGQTPSRPSPAGKHQQWAQARRCPPGEGAPLGLQVVAEALLHHVQQLVAVPQALQQPLVRAHTDYLHGPGQRVEVSTVRLGGSKVGSEGTHAAQRSQ